MSRVINYFMGVFVVLLAYSSAMATAQTTKQLFEWQKIPTAVGIYNMDPACWRVSEIQGSTAYTGTAFVFEAVYCTGYAKPIISIYYNRQNSSGLISDCQLSSNINDPSLIFDGLGNGCAHGTVNAILPQQLSTPRDLAYWMVTIGKSTKPSYSFSDSSCHEVVTALGGDGYWTPYKYSSNIYCSGFNMPVLTLNYTKYGSDSLIRDCSFVPGGDMRIIYSGARGCSGGLVQTTQPK